MKSQKMAIGISSLLFQGAGFLYMLASKHGLSDADFSEVMALLALAGIAASVSTLRTEILLYKEKGMASGGVVAVPIVLSLVMTLAATLLFILLYPLGQSGCVLPFLFFALSFGLSVCEYQNFFSIQTSSYRWLISIRVLQLIVVGAGSLFAVVKSISNYEYYLFLYAFSVLVPSLTWLLFFLYFSGVVSIRELISDIKMTFGRGILLSMSVLLNSLSVNMPVIIANMLLPSVQSASFVFLQKIFTAPVTLVRQVYGQYFTYKILNDGAFNIYERMLRLVVRVVLSGSGLYVLLSSIIFLIILINPGLIGLQEGFGFSAVFVFLAILCQVAYSPISNIRVFLKAEGIFSFLDAARVVLLVGVLFSSLASYSLLYLLASFSGYAAYFIVTLIIMRKKLVAEDSSVQG